MAWENYTVYIYWFASAPLFNLIDISGENVRGSVTLDFDDLEKVSNGTSAFNVFLLVVLGGAILALTIYALMIIITLGNKKLGLTTAQEEKNL